MNESDEGTERRVVSPVPSPLRVLRSSLTPSVVRSSRPRSGECKESEGRGETEGSSEEPIGVRDERGKDVDGLHLGFSCRSTFVSPVHMPSAVRSSLVVASSLLSDVPQAGARPPAERYATGRRPRNGRREG